jgi:hypothetical protein
MKVKLLSRLNTIEVKGSLDEMSKQFNREPELIIKHYDIIFGELEPTFKKYAGKDIYELNGKIQYLKVINELEIDSYSDDIFEEIIGITFNLLQDE